MRGVEFLDHLGAGAAILGDLVNVGNLRPPIPSAQVDAALKRITRLIGWQIAGEAFEASAAANENEHGLSDDTRPEASISPYNED